MALSSSIAPPLHTERRVSERRGIEGLVDLELGSENSGVLFDLSEGGVGFQSFAPVSLNQAILLRFSVPGTTEYIESFATVAWLNESGKGGGLCFSELSAEARAQIRSWTGPTQGSNSASAPKVAAQASVGTAEIEPAVTKKATRNTVPSVTIAAKVPPAARIPSADAGNRVHSDLSAASATESANVAARRGSPLEPAATAAPVLHRVPASPAWANANGGPVAKQTPPEPMAPIEHIGPSGYSDDAEVSAPPLRRLQTARHKHKDVEVGEDHTTPAEARLWNLLKFGFAAAGGAILVFAIVALVPSLRARIQSTASATLGSTSVAAVPAFEVEVADLNNRRWILKSGDEAGSPFVSAPSRLGAPAAASSRREEPEKIVSRASDATDGNDTSASRKSLAAQRGALALAVPVVNRRAAGADVQTLATSIFDGITPPIGSLSAALPVIGPAMPGPVAPPPEGSRHVAPQAAVLVQRVSPIYPNLALANHLGGEVLVSATIGKDGVPTNLKVVSGNPQLTQAALVAMRQWRYRPATVDGKPIETSTTTTFAFEFK